LEFVALVVFGVLALGLLIAAVVVLPFMLLGGLLKFLVFAIALPFRLIGALFGAVTGAVGALFGGIAALGSVLLAVVFVFGGLLLLPLLPFLVLFGLIWVFSRSTRRASA
jgi:hypothetical protein